MLSALYLDVTCASPVFKWTNPASQADVSEIPHFALHSFFITNFLVASGSSRPVLYIHFISRTIMTDPISLTGTAVGIVSLGLTVCQSLVSYYDSWKSHDEQVKEAVMRIGELENVLDVLSGRLARLPSYHEVSSQVETLAVSCKASMKKLGDIFEECRKAGTPSTLKEKIQAQGRKALFPFKKDTLESIKATSRDIISVLNIALETLQV